MTAFDRVVDLLGEVKYLHPRDVMAHCPRPAHGKGRGDLDPSLHVTERDGKVLIDCKSGICHVQDVLLALGLDYPDLFDEPPERSLVASYTYCRPDGTPYHISERWQTRTGKTFRQRMADSNKPGLEGNKPAIYRLPQVLAAAKAGRRIYWVEGEKSVHAAESIGLVATCCTNGVSGWRTYYPDWLKGASEVVVVTDNDEVGKTFAAQVVAAMRGAGLRSKAMRVAVAGDKADLYDHVAAGHGEADLIDVNLNRLRPSGSTMNALVVADFPPVRWAVDGLISAGLTLLGGAPKIGKSFITLDLALGVACGGRALSSLTCQQGDVLYLSLDNDTERRIAERAAYLLVDLPEEDIPIETHIDWPTGHAAIAACQEWVNEAPNPLLVVIDTFVRVEPAFEGDGRTTTAYAASVECLSRWSRFAIENNLAVVAVHHDRKSGKDGEKGDWLDRYMGSRGVTATAQTLLMIEAERGKDVGTLRVSGRDLETDDLEMHRNGRAWIVMDPPRPVHAVPKLHVVK